MNNQSKHQLVLEAQKEQIVIIADRRVALRIDLDEMQAIGGHDDYEPSLLVFLEKYNNGQTTTDMLRDVYPDARQLKKAIAKLARDGAIKAEPKGQITFITLVKVQTPNAVAAEDGPTKEETK